MARALTVSMVNACTAAWSRPCLFFEGVFASSTLRLWNGTGDLAWNSHTWLGNGWFQGFEGAEESVEVEANDLAVVLTGVPASVLSLLLGQQAQGATGTLYFGAFDSNGALMADPYVAWQGEYSHADVDDDPSQPTARLYYDSPLIDLDRPNEGRWTHDHQQQLFPADLGFQYVVQAANWQSQWGQGKKEPVRPRPPRGGGKKGGGRRR